MSYKIYYNSKLAKVLTFIKDFSTMMFFGVIITEKSSLTKREEKHEEAHVYQYRDCVMTGLYLAIILTFTLAGFDVVGSWMLSFILLPFTLYYIIYGIHYLYNLIRYRDLDKAYRNICFENHAYWIEETWNKPCEEQHDYVSFGWLKSH